MKRSISLHLLAMACLSNAALADATTPLRYTIAAAPHVKKSFHAGDAIEIEEIAGTAADFRVGGTYRVRGVCRQRTLANAQLYLGNTSTAADAIRPAAGWANHLKLPQGETPFDFTVVLQAPGELHVTIYDLDNHDPQDNAYAGLVLGAVTGPPAAGAGNVNANPPDTAISVGGNAAMMAYLGSPVPAPAGLEERFRGNGLLAAFKNLCAREGYTITKLAVDETEFPYLVYGRIAGKKEASGFSKELAAMKPYGYGGSVEGCVGTGEANYFSLNMTPLEPFAAEAASGCRRRLMVRLQMLADAASRD